jgi:4-diphosphocytidyl-2-C-methyl-D-erythritol kinase
MRLRQSGAAWIVHAPAKLNLFLEVTGKRADGFHELETLMVSVNLFDTLVFTQESSTQISLRCHYSGCVSRKVATDSASASDEVPDGRDNLAVKAGELLKSKTGVDKGVHIELFKRIPAEAGLAGGSSDAAAVLLALNRIWNLGLSRDELQRYASEIGSDVAFFLSDTPAAICQGRGEIICPLRSAPRLHFVIVKPDSGLSTAAVFRKCRPEVEPCGASQLVECLQRGDLTNAGRNLFNSLQAPAESLNPEVRRVINELDRQPFIGHMMTGSGTSCFGVCRHRNEARMAAARLKALGLGRVFVGETSF